MKKSFVVKVNMDRIVMNLVKNKLWYDTDIKSKMLRDFEYKSSLLGLENDVNYEGIKEIYTNYIISLENENNFKKLINHIKEQDIVRTFTNMLKSEGIEEYFKTSHDLHLYIINNIIPVAKAI